MRDWVRGRRAAFFGNLGLIALLAWLVAPLLDRRSADPVVLGRYSLQFAIYLLAWLGLIVMYAGAAVAFGRRGNRVLLFSVLAALLVGESVVRMRGSGGYFEQQADQLRGPVPYVHWLGEALADLPGPPRMGGSEDEQRLILNELGLRGEVPPMPKREFRVLVLGGSTVLVGAPLARSIPGELQTRLRAASADVRVYNWGVTSFVSGQELSLLTHLGEDYAPNLVVVYDGGNDMLSPYMYDPRPGYPYDWLVTEAGLGLIRGGAPSGTYPALLLLRSRLAATVFRESLTGHLVNLEALREQSGYQTAPWRDEIVALYFGNLRKMCSVARGMGARLAAFVQPTVFTKEPLAGGEPVMAGDPRLRAHMEAVHAAIRARAAVPDLPEGCSVTDVSDALDGMADQVFWDVVHVTNEGNTRVAQRIADDLLARGLIAR